MHIEGKHCVQRCRFKSFSKQILFVFVNYSVSSAISIFWLNITSVRAVNLFTYALISIQAHQFSLAILKRLDLCELKELKQPAFLN